jgi:hypothetical protein
MAMCGCFACIRKRTEKALECENVPDEEVDYFEIVRNHELSLESIIAILDIFQDVLNQVEKRLDFLEKEYIRQNSNGRCAK